MRGDIPLSAFGQGSGSMGLNGDFTYYQGLYGQRMVNKIFRV